MKKSDGIDVSWNIEILATRKNGSVELWHQRTHNIVVNTGRQFFAEAITASSFSPTTRTQDTVVRYIGFGIGGAMQDNPAAAGAPYSADYPGTNVQTDTDVTVSKLERPVKVTAAPLWMNEVATPGTFPTATSVMYVASFASSDLSFGGYTAPPLSEIGLFKSSADPAQPNGGSGAYPGSGGHLVAYDTFTPFPKSAIFGFEVRWTLRFGS